MKGLCLILALLVLGLSVQPACAAFSLTESNIVATTDTCCPDETTSSPGQEDSSKKDCHGCNPFHSCSCCVAGIVLPPAFKMQPAITSKHTIITGSYEAPRLPQVAFDFWQPPRVF